MTTLKVGKYLLTLIGDEGNLTEIFHVIQRLFPEQVSVAVWNSRTDRVKTGFGKAQKIEEIIAQ